MRWWPTISQRGESPGRQTSSVRPHGQQRWQSGKYCLFVCGAESLGGSCYHCLSLYITSLLREVLDACEPRAATVVVVASPVWWLAHVAPHETLGVGGAGRQDWGAGSSVTWACPHPFPSSGGSGTWGRPGVGGRHPHTPSVSPLDSPPLSSLVSPTGRQSSPHVPPPSPCAGPPPLPHGGALHHGRTLGGSCCSSPCWRRGWRRCSALADWSQLGQPGGSLIISWCVGVFGEGRGLFLARDTLLVVG